jgi:hypothetical protein
MVSILSFVVKLLDVPWLVGEHASEVAYVKCRSGEGARRAQRCCPICHGPLRSAGGGGRAKAVD